MLQNSDSKITAILTLFDKLDYSLKANYKENVQKEINDLNRRRLFNTAIEVQNLYKIWENYARSVIESLIKELINQNLACCIDKNNSIIIEKIDELINEAIRTKFHFRGENRIKNFENSPYKTKPLEFKNELIEIWNREATLISLNPEKYGKIDKEETWLLKLWKKCFDWFINNVFNVAVGAIITIIITYIISIIFKIKE